MQLMCNLHAFDQDQAQGQKSQGWRWQAIANELSAQDSQGWKWLAAPMQGAATMINQPSDSGSYSVEAFWTASS